MSRIPRSMEATSVGEAAAVARGRRSLPNGLWGIALFIATEATMFGAIIATYFYLRFKHAGWPLDGIAPPKPALPLAITAALAATTLPMLLASRAVRAARRGAAVGWILFAMAVQCGYLAVQIVLFSDDLSRFTPDQNAYGSIYYALLGASHFHVLVGIVLSGWVAARLLAGVTNYRVVAVRVISWYWYFVAAVTVAVTLTQLSSSL
ncbi:MAG: cytochrome c oxidase subunit 3 [Actinobacteria bacterium]|nr:cytochrome c oxidase subunit 3 [Actinomycetota bacterium]